MSRRRIRRAEDCNPEKEDMYGDNDKQDASPESAI
jgi:hypothetical protein